MIGIINNHSYNVYNSDNQTIVDQKQILIIFLTLVMHNLKKVRTDDEHMQLTDGELLLWHPQSVNNYYDWYYLRSGFYRR